MYSRDSCILKFPKYCLIGRMCFCAEGSPLGGGFRRLFEERTMLLAFGARSRCLMYCSLTSLEISSFAHLPVARIRVYEVMGVREVRTLTKKNIHTP